jgi:hypothetical protein
LAARAVAGSSGGAPGTAGADGWTPGGKADREGPGADAKGEGAAAKGEGANHQRARRGRPAASTVSQWRGSAPSQWASTGPKPSPPSAIGQRSSWSWGRCRRQPAAMAWAAAAASKEPLKASGAINTRRGRSVHRGVATSSIARCRGELGERRARAAPGTGQRRCRLVCRPAVVHSPRRSRIWRQRPQMRPCTPSARR